MKNILIAVLTLIGSLYILPISAQRLMINEALCQTDDVNQPGIEVILEPGTKTIKKAIKDWMEDN